jgi:hypothetical protein
MKARQRAHLRLPVSIKVSTQVCLLPTHIQIVSTNIWYKYCPDTWLLCSSAAQVLPGYANAPAPLHLTDWPSYTTLSTTLLASMAKAAAGTMIASMAKAAAGTMIASMAKAAAGTMIASMAKAAEGAMI